MTIVVDSDLGQIPPWPSKIDFQMRVNEGVSNVNTNKLSNNTKIKNIFRIASNSEITKFPKIMINS